MRYCASLALLVAIATAGQEVKILPLVTRIFAVSCYFFVRPKRNVLELCIFLGRTVEAPQVRRVDRASKSKIFHIVHIRHRDEVEEPITDWLREAYEMSDVLSSKPGGSRRRRRRTPSRISPPDPSQKQVDNPCGRGLIAFCQGLTRMSAANQRRAGR